MRETCLSLSLTRHWWRKIRPSTLPRHLHLLLCSSWAELNAILCLWPYANVVVLFKSVLLLHYAWATEGAGRWGPGVFSFTLLEQDCRFWKYMRPEGLQWNLVSCVNSDGVSGPFGLVDSSPASSSITF